MTAALKYWQTMSPTERNKTLERPAISNNETIAAQANDIISEVRRNGDSALLEYTRRFDRCELESLRVSDEEFLFAEDTLSNTVKQAIDIAITNVRAVHLAQIPAETSVDVQAGVRCERHNRAIDAVGLYVPSGSAPLPSTAIMLGVPASVAACPTRIVCTPASEDGTVHPATLYAARKSGVTEVFKIGGAQAIAAMAFGTDSVPKVNKIFGPGNAWVTAAKRIVANDYAGAAIDMPAGPSEVMVIADAGANPSFAAADLLAQAEHGIDSQVLLVTDSEQVANAVVQEIEAQIRGLSRNRTIRQALEHSHILVVENIKEALDVCNDYAPEHLILLVDEPRSILAGVVNAGAVFIGPYSPESAGDYCSGANHVLPTYGAAKYISGLGVEQFMRQISVQELSRNGLAALAPTIEALATAEGLDAHAAAVRIRLAQSSNRGAIA